MTDYDFMRWIQLGGITSDELQRLPVDNVVISDFRPEQQEELIALVQGAFALVNRNYTGRDGAEPYRMVPIVIVLGEYATLGPVVIAAISQAGIAFIERTEWPDRIAEYTKPNGKTNHYQFYKHRKVSTTSDVVEESLP